MFNTTLAITQDRTITGRRWLFLLILTLMSTAGLVGSDVYLPALPAIGVALNQNAHAMQLTLSIYLFGLSIGQLILGPLTDRFGRKKLIIAGMLLYFVASMSCAISVSYPQMLLSRFLQALGACSGLVIGRAIVGDIFDAKEAGKVFATIFPIVGMSPSISPVMGGLIAYYLGWQSTFVFVGLFGMSVALLTIYYIPETLSRDKLQSISFIQIFLGYPKLLMNKKFISYVAAPCAAYIAYFAYIAQSPFIFHAYGFGERAIGTFYITLSLTYVIGSLTGRKLLNHFDLDRVILFGFIVFNIGGFLLLLGGLLGSSVILMVAAISILTLGNGFLIPLGSAGVIGLSKKSIGYASGLLGFLQLGSAALSATFVGPLTHNSIFKLGIYIFSVTLIGIILFTAILKKAGDKQC